MQENKINHIICWMNVIIYCLGCIRFGLIGDGESDSRSSLWNSARIRTTEDLQLLFSSDLFLSVFCPDIPQLSQASLLRVLPNNASIHSAQWHFDSEYIDQVNYYCDKRGCCLIVSYVNYGEPPLIIPYNEWYYINSNGLIRFDWLKLIADLFFIMALYILPWLLLIKIAIYLHKSIKNSNFAPN